MKGYKKNKIKKPYDKICLKKCTNGKIKKLQQWGGVFEGYYKYTQTITDLKIVLKLYVVLWWAWYLQTTCRGAIKPDYTEQGR